MKLDAMESVSKKTGRNRDRVFSLWFKIETGYWTGFFKSGITDRKIEQG